MIDILCNLPRSIRFNTISRTILFFSLTWNVGWLIYITDYTLPRSMVKPRSGAGKGGCLLGMCAWWLGRGTQWAPRETLGKMLGCGDLKLWIYLSNISYPSMLICNLDYIIILKKKKHIPNWHLKIGISAVLGNCGSIYCNGKLRPFHYHAINIIPWYTMCCGISPTFLTAQAWMGYFDTSWLLQKWGSNQ